MGPDDQIVLDTYGNGLRIAKSAARSVATTAGIVIV